MSIHQHIALDAAEAAAHAAEHIAMLLDTALASNRKATIALSGGSTPALMFDALAALPVRWERVHIFFVDEREVPPGNSQSNYTLAETRLVHPARIPRANVHRMLAEQGAAAAARQYAAKLREFFELSDGQFPHFDIVHLGIGNDGHTASLFPGEPLIDDRAGLCAAVHVAKLEAARITLLPGVLLAARHTVVLAAGAEKAAVLKTVLRGPYDPKQYPAQVVTHHARNVHWFLDAGAAAGLDE